MPECTKLPTPPAGYMLELLHVRGCFAYLIGCAEALDNVGIRDKALEGMIRV